MNYATPYPSISWMAFWSAMRTYPGYVSAQDRFQAYSYHYLRATLPDNFTGNVPEL